VDELGPIWGKGIRGFPAVVGGGRALAARSLRPNAARLILARPSWSIPRSPSS